MHRDVLPRHTIDGHYVIEACPDVTRCHVVNDSDELVAFELTRADRAFGTHVRGRGVSRLGLAAVAATCNPHQLAHFRQPTRLHADALDARWAVTEGESARFVEQLERYRPVGRLLITLYRWRKRSRRRFQSRMRTMRWTARHYVRAVRGTMRRAARKRGVYGRAVRHAVWPRVSAKQLARPLKVLYHRATKASRLGVKRIRRRVRTFRTA